MSDADPFGLKRFVDAQATAYDEALAELRRGSKQGHWMWYVFPQLKGLGLSPIAEHFGITGLEEARAYLAHPLLGTRLRECVAALLEHRERSAERMLGTVDALKLRSSLTLFAHADRAVAEFGEAINAFYAGARDPVTLRMLRDRV